GRLGLEYSAQYFYNGSGTNGSLDFGRTVGTPESAATVDDVRNYSPTAEGAVDSSGTRMSELQHAIDARLALTMRPLRALYVTAGASALDGRVARVWKQGLTMTAQRDVSQFAQVAGELTAAGSAGAIGWRLLGEYLHQFGPGMRPADYILAGVKGTFKSLAAYLNFSYVEYQLTPKVQEYIIQPGLSYAIGGGLAVLVEYDEWQRNAGGGYKPIDRSLDVVLAYSY
ncbi:MAG: hypothetical protein LC659_15110, partial [Myxococcales bacterium]|nr:hypothetical protein [Myxococcales bacterium]